MMSAGLLGIVMDGRLMSLVLWCWPYGIGMGGMKQVIRHGIKSWPENLPIPFYCQLIGLRLNLLRTFDESLLDVIATAAEKHFIHHV